MAVSPADEVLSMTSSLSNATNPAAILTASYGPNGPVSYTLCNGLTGVIAGCPILSQSYRERVG